MQKHGYSLATMWRCPEPITWKHCIEAHAKNLAREQDS